MTNKKRKQHFVPQSHIKNFSYINNNTYKVIVKDKYQDNTYPSSIDDIACKRDFYEVSEKENNYWEDWYAKIDDIIPNVYNSIFINVYFSKDGDKVLSEFLKNQMSLIILSQLLRTRVAKKYYIEKGLEISNAFINKVKEELKDILDLKQIEKLDKYASNEDFIFSTALEHFNSKEFIRKGTNILLNKVWIVHKNLNYKTMPFVTNDNPVILYNFFTNKFGFGYNGIDREETIVYFAISKEILIALYPKGWNLLEKNNTVSFLEDKKFIMKFNAKSYEHCERQMFSSPN